MSGNDGSGILTVMAWNTENKEDQRTTCSFDCEANAVLYRHFLQKEPILVLLLVDKEAKWNQELENVYLISCQVFSDGEGRYTQDYEYELRPDCE